MSKIGFEPTAATFTTDGTGKVSWTVTMTRRSQGTMTITGSRGAYAPLLGKIIWERDGQTYRYTYTGTPFTPTSE
jgi:hypothetical protein